MQAGKSKLNRINLDDSAVQTALAAQHQPEAALACYNTHMAMGEGRGNEALHAWRGRRGTLLDIAALPDSEPLNQQERNLCATERYLPAQLVAIKGDLLQPGKDGQAFKIDPERSARVFDFFKQQ